MSQQQREVKASDLYHSHRIELLISNEHPVCSPATNKTKAKFMHVFVLFNLTGTIRSDANMSGNPDKADCRFSEWTNSSRK